MDITVVRDDGAAPAGAAGMAPLGLDMRVAGLEERMAGVGAGLEEGVGVGGGAPRDEYVIGGGGSGSGGGGGVVVRISSVKGTRARGVIVSGPRRGDEVEVILPFWNFGSDGLQGGTFAAVLGTAGVTGGD